MNKNKKGFTVIEILVIVCIITILVTVVLISLISAREKAQNNSNFTSFKSLAAPAFACLISSTEADLTNPSGSNTNICSIGAVPNSNWPDFSKSGWSYSWCDPRLSAGAVPPVSCPSYSDGSCGGTGGAGDFCFMLTKEENKKMWCTVDGCRKEGF